MTNIRPMMKCGHSANATCDNKPACAICGCTEIAEVQPSLEGRKARCCYYNHCHGETDSRLTLPFFEYKPDEEYDSYYNGCFGWN